ncbi:adenosylcobinamide-GDP ribazoletransferase [Fredinandcohnia sp. SECRCQ15]|uniref:Adenosylcobinamide-GDP ribazoletransferase n=2 Tax=Fredinandcohnia quinoae TaxID=2918902 RepID=A0AAW5E8S0_9BACI|nr:adenosylcobinamide-GDP ribazoletransferase [Fredinandcohnia sp. SECRCQ15]MCH1626412.1 adenosylcobinamide-GDP ribazoletransferase [Fredinandcohnia sp. SECRCQ15]
MRFLKGFLINLQFFTSIPIPIVIPMDRSHLKNAVRTFPLLGLFQGAIYSSLFYILIEWSLFSSLAIAFVIWLMTIVISGGIHLDGWMDASDAYFSYQDKEKRLEIMKDPRTGAFGVLSVIVLLSSRFLFLYEITLMSTADTYLLILLIPFFSKSVMGGLLLTVNGAKNEGLGAMFQKSATSRDLWVYCLYVTLVYIFCYRFILELVILSAMTIVVFIILRKKIVKWFSGITGDVIGASVEGTEWMLWMTVWLLHYFVMV